MKQFTLTTSLLICTSLISLNVFANPLSKDGALLSQTYNWSGFYAGGNLGIVKNTMRITDNQATTFNATVEQETNPKLAGGFQLGARRQLDLAKTSGVYGLEFSMDFSDAKFSTDYGSPFALYQLSAKNQLKNLFLLQLMGGIATDNTLLFLAAGVSWTKVNGSIINQDGIPFFESLYINKTEPGMAFGGGIEYAYNERVSLRLKVDVIPSDRYTVRDSADSIYQVSNTAVLGVLGINYKLPV